MDMRLEIHIALSIASKYCECVGFERLSRPIFQTQIMDFLKLNSDIFIIDMPFIQDDLFIIIT